MARGRAGSYDSGVVILTRRADVPVDPEFEYRDSRKAQRISDYADEDAQSISNKSRMKDKELLNNITQKLHANNAYVPPVSFCRPQTNNVPRTRRLSLPRALPESVLFIRAGSVPPRSSRINTEYYYDDIDDAMSTPAPPPPPLPPRKTPRRFLKKRPVYRASSEPPPASFRAPPQPSPTLPISPTYFPGPVTYVTYRPWGYTGAEAVPPRYVDYGHRPSQFTPSTSEAVRNAKRYLDRIERELGVANAPSTAEPVIIHHVNAAPARVVPRSAARVAAARTAGVRSSSLPPSPRVGARRGSRVRTNIEARLAEQLHDYDYPAKVTVETTPEPCSLSEIRSRTTQAKNKLDTHKTLMDRYLPIYFGPENEVRHEVDYKYGELVNRMPILDKYRPTQGGVTLASIPPYKPSAVKSKPPVNPGPPTREGFRPAMSDTRKRIREVLCATKKDPHYYD